MTELGFAGAIVINPDRTIIAGHARYRAAMLLGLGQVSERLAKSRDAA